MKIILVVTGLPDKANPARSVFNLRYAQELKAKGHTVTFVYLRAFKPQRSFFNSNKVNEITVFECCVLLPKIKYLSRTTPLPFLFKWILEKNVCRKVFENADVVHAVHRESIEFGYLLSKRFHKPLISQFIGGSLGSELPSLSKREGFLNGISYSKFLCFNSDKLRQDFIRFHEVGFETRVLYRGVKLEDFPYHFTQSDELNILFLGGFPGRTNLKGGISILEAIKLLDHVPLVRKVKFTIGGPNSLDYKNSFPLLTNPNISISFIGAIDKDAVKNQMRESQIVIIPSLAEGVPNILYEAMSSGNLVIGSDVGGIPEILDHGATGFLIKPGEPEELKLAIHNAVNAPECIEVMAKNSRKKIESLSYEKFLNGYLDLYMQAIDSE